MPRPKAGDGDSDLIRYALAGIDAEIKELQEKRAEMLKRAPKSADTTAAAAPVARKRRGRKPGSRKAVKAAAQKVVAKKAVKAGAKKAAKSAAKAVVAAAPRKRKVSPETRRKLKEAAKARWAKARAAKGA